MDNEFNKIKEDVRLELSNFLGVETGDIEEDSILTEDLHMKASDLGDFMAILTRMGLETNKVDLAGIETFLDLIEALNE